MDGEAILAKVEGLSERAMALRARARGLMFNSDHVLVGWTELRSFVLKLDTEAAEIDAEIAALVAALRDETK